MSKLVEAEMDGAAAAKQVMALKDTIGKLKTVGGRQSNLDLGLGPEKGQPQAGVGALRSYQANFMTSPGWGRAHLTLSPQLHSGLGPDPQG